MTTESTAPASTPEATAAAPSVSVESIQSQLNTSVPPPTVAAETPPPAPAESAPALKESEPAAPKPETEDAQPKKDKGKDRFAQLFAQAQQSKAEAIAAKADAERARAELAKLRSVDPATLTLDQQQALTLKDVLKTETLETATRTAQAKLTEAHQAQLAAFNAKVEAAKKEGRFQDFEKVFHPNLPIPDSVAELIAESDRGPEIAYHLGLNPEEARTIAALPPHKQGVEIAKLETKLSVQRRAVSTAPPPPPTLAGASSPSAKDPNNMSMSEFAAWLPGAMKAARR
ncbi:MAG: hypothetical protein KGP14_08130 [Betaproteobacteria bacterium]|nr:hypothetical protein [Betaproteobacteria bacterium]